MLGEGGGVGVGVISLCILPLVELLLPQLIIADVSGLRSGMISSELVENITSNEVKEEYSRDLSLPRSYEAAMEALSSLISGRKRGKKNVVLGKYSKLERMMMYVKVI